VIDITQYQLFPAMLHAEPQLSALRPHMETSVSLPRTAKFLQPTNTISSELLLTNTVSSGLFHSFIAEIHLCQKLYFGTYFCTCSGTASTKIRGVEDKAFAKKVESVSQANAINWRRPCCTIQDSIGWHTYLRPDLIQTPQSAICTQSKHFPHLYF